MRLAVERRAVEVARALVCEARLVLAGRALVWAGRLAEPRRADVRPACRRTDLGTPPCNHAWVVMPFEMVFTGACLSHSNAASSGTPGATVRKTSRALDHVSVPPISRERDLSTRLGLNVQIVPEGRGGSLRISYRNLDQLDAVLSLLTRS